MRLQLPTHFKLFSTFTIIAIIAIVWQITRNTKMTIKVGDTIPSGKFSTIPYDPAVSDAKVCGIPTQVSTDSWKGKKIVLFAVPGAFTPGCQANHLPPFLANADQFKAKGIDQIVCIASNDAFVMDAWSKVNDAQGRISFLSDGNAAWSKELGLSLDLTAAGMGIRTARYALVIDDLQVHYVGVEPGREISVSGAEAVLAKL